MHLLYDVVVENKRFLLYDTLHCEAEQPWWFNGKRIGFCSNRMWFYSHLKWLLQGLLSRVRG